MLPLVANEDQIFTFRFWFHNTLRMGMHHHGELFCQLQSFDLHQRSQVYQRGCQLTQRGIVTVITVGVQTCSLWISLRHPNAAEFLDDPAWLELPKKSSA